MGVGLGKANYCMRYLTEKGEIQITKPNKLLYYCLLAPKGIDERAILTISFLKRKVIEHDILKKELNELKLESEELNNERQ